MDAPEHTPDSDGAPVRETDKARHAALNNRMAEAGRQMEQSRLAVEKSQRSLASSQEQYRRIAEQANLADRQIRSAAEERDSEDDAAETDPPLPSNG